MSKYYTKEAHVATYIEGIYPSGPNFFTNDHIVYDFQLPILPSDERRRPGRPKMSRIPSVGEHVFKSGHCESCGKGGHNKRTCSNKGVLSIQQEQKRKTIQLFYFDIFAKYR